LLYNKKLEIKWRYLFYSKLWYCTSKRK